MEDWQRKHIRDNLVHLIDLTVVNTCLLAHLEEGKILHKADIEELKQHDRQDEKSLELYSILQTRKNSYETITRALYITKQTGAFEILLNAFDRANINNPFKVCEINLDLHEIFQKIVLCQGTETCLSDICMPKTDDDAHNRLKSLFVESLSAKDYLQLTDKTTSFVLVADSVPKPPPYYVKRTLKKQAYLDNKLFAHACLDVFVFMGVSLSELSKLAGDNQLTDTWSFDKKICTVRFMRLEPNHNGDIVLRRIAKYGASPVHLIQYERDNGKYKLVKSYGGVNTIHKFLTPEYITFSENDLATFNANCSHDSFKEHFCLSDTPGMGKSVFLSQVADQLKSSSNLVLFTKFSEIVEKICKHKIFFENVWKNLMGMLSPSTFGQKLIQKLIFEKSANLNVFIDGYDELLPSQLELAKELLVCIVTGGDQEVNCKLFITTRPHYRFDLEAILGTLSFEMAPFTESDRLDCILSHWGNKGKLQPSKELETFAEMCLKTLSIQVGGSYEDSVAGIPLQCWLLAEVNFDAACNLQATRDPTFSGMGYMETLQFGRAGNSDSPLINLYAHLMAMRFASAAGKYTNSCDNTVFHQNALNAHILSAIELLFPDWTEKLATCIHSCYTVHSPEILDIGIIVKHGNSDPRFIHRTFAEYLIAYCLVVSYYEQIDEHKYLTEFLYTRILSTIGFTENVLTFNPFNLANTQVRSFQFLYPTILLFINGLLGCAHGETNFELPVFQTTYSSLSNVTTFFEAAIACQRMSHVHLLRLLRKMYFCGNLDHIELQIEEIYIPWEQLILIATKYGSVCIINECVDLLLLVGRETSIFKVYKYITASNGGVNPLHIAVERGSFKIFEFFYKLAKRQGFRFFPGQHLLYLCVGESYNNDLQMVQEKTAIMEMLLESSDKEKIINEMYADIGPNMLLDSVHIKLLICLLRNGASITGCSPKTGDTILHKAANYLLGDEFYELLSYLAEHSDLLGLLYKCNMYGQCAMHLAISKIDLSQNVFTLLKSVGFDVNIPNALDETILSLAVKNGRSKRVLKSIVEFGVKTPLMLRDGTEMHLAVYYDNVEAIQFFTEHGIDPNITNRNGYTAQKLAIKLKRPNFEDICKILLTNGASFDAEDMRIFKPEKCSPASSTTEAANTKSDFIRTDFESASNPLVSGTKEVLASAVVFEGTQVSNFTSQVTTVATAMEPTTTLDLDFYGANFTPSLKTLALETGEAVEEPQELIPEKIKGAHDSTSVPGTPKSMRKHLNKYRLDFGAQSVRYEVWENLRSQWVNLMTQYGHNLIESISNLLNLELSEHDHLMSPSRTLEWRAHVLFHYIQNRNASEIVACLEMLCDLVEWESFSSEFIDAIITLYPNAFIDD